MDLQKIATETIKEMHKTDKTCGILYDAIEKCGDMDFIYHRDIILDDFSNNENLIQEKDGRYYYSHTQHLFERDIDETKFDQLMNELKYPQVDEDFTEEEAIDFTKQFYRDYLGHYFAICLIRINEDNASVFDF